MIKETCNIDQMISYLNELVVIDKKTINYLFNDRIYCNDKLADHPTCIVMGDSIGNKVGLLGILNGVFGIDNDNYGSICVELDSDNKIIKFIRMSEHHKKTKTKNY